ncbi:hypothetical protein CapIbe_012926 [Capra ibex]
MESSPPVSTVRLKVFILQSRILPSTCASLLFLHPMQPPPRSRRAENKTVSSAVSGLLAEVLFPPVPVIPCSLDYLSPLKLEY